MKTFRTIGALALCAVLVPALSSCGGDDDDDEPGNGGVIVMDGTRLTSVSNYRISYDADGRLKRISSPFTGNGNLLEIDYADGTITLDDGEDEMEYMDVKFNGNGYISRLSSSWDYTENDGGDRYRYTGDGRMTFSYNGDGNLVKIDCEMTETEKDLDDNSTERFTERYTISYDWRNGNLVRAVEEGREIEDGDDDDWTDTYTLEYGNLPNTFLQTPATIAYIGFDESAMQLLAMAGLFGNGPEMLPSEMTDDEDGYTDTWRIVFSLNSNGSIAEERNGYRGYTYGYSNITRAAQGPKLDVKASVRDIFRKHASRK